MIKIDMEMPNECHECPFQMKWKDSKQDDWYMRRCIIKNQIIEYPRPKWCPLINIDEQNYKNAQEAIFK